MKVATQTITAPIVTALLYLLIFGHALEDYVQIYPGVGYTTFLVPGLVMMSLLQNSFANSSSSLIQSKINGSLVFILLAPISHWQLYLAYMLAAVVRGLIVATGVFIITVCFYLVDGFRYGFFGHSDVNPWTSFCIVSIFFLLLALLAVHLLQKGYKLRF